MAGRNIRFSNASLFFSLLIAGVVLLFLPQKINNKICFAFRDTFEPMLQLGRDVQMHASQQQPGQEDTVKYSDYEKLWRAYNNLNAVLDKERQNYETLANLRSNLPKLYSGIVLADVVSQISNYSHEITINQGSNAGIQKGQIALCSPENISVINTEKSIPGHLVCGVIGIVRETSEAMARIRLITDEKQNLEIVIRRVGTDKNIGAMMIGNGKDACKVLLLDREQDVREGDTVYAAAYPGWLETPVVVGEVSRVQPDEKDPLLWDITVQPAMDLARLETVAVVVTNEKLLLDRKSD